MIQARRAPLAILLNVLLGITGCRDDEVSPPGDTETDTAGLDTGDTDDPSDDPPWACVIGCGDGICDAAAGEDCSTCIVDCAADACTDGPAFGPGDTAIALGPVFEDRCGDGVYRAHPTRGLSEGASPLPFKQGQTKLLLAPPSCGGVDDSDPTIATGVALRDGALGLTVQCLTLGPNSKTVPVEVGLRYEVGRWNEPDPSLPGFYARPGSLDLAPFWFVSWSRRLHGAFPEWEAQPWDPDELPASFDLVLEDYSLYRFERDGNTHRYLQPGASVGAAVAFAEIVVRDDPTACASAGDPSRAIADNDVIVHYADGTRDVFSGRDLTFKAHVDNFQNHLLVSHGLRDAGGAPVCGDGSGAIGVKRIASYPVDANEPLLWIDLEHHYVELAHPSAPGGVLGLWRVQRIVDSEDREIVVDYDPSAPDRVTAVTAFPGRPEEQVYAFGYDALGVVSSVSMPVSGGDTSNTLTVVHEHPSDLPQGGLSRVASQSRTIGGQGNRTTSFEWSDGTSHDLEVTYPDGRTQRFGHEQPQGSTATPLLAPGRDDDRITAAYDIDATTNPGRTAFDPVTGFITETCDQLSFGPTGNPQFPGSRCTGYVYDSALDLVAITSRNEDGAVVRAELEHEVFPPGNDHRTRLYRGPEGDETTYEHVLADTWMEGEIATVHLTEVRDPLGNATTYEWCTGTAMCPKGLVASTTSPLGGQTNFVYSPELGTPTLRRHPDETQQRLGYDARGCLVEMDDMHGVKTQYEHDPGQGDCMPVRSIRNPGGSPEIVTEYEYDAARNLVRRTVDADGSWSNSSAVIELVHQVVDVEGGTAVVEERRGGLGGSFIEELRSSFDVQGLLLELEEVSMGRSTTISYQFLPNGSAITTTTRSGIAGAKVVEHNAAGQLVRSTDERGVTDEVVYSPSSGRVVEERSGSGAEQIVTTYEYFDDGLLEQASGPDGVTAYEYDAGRRNTRVSTNDITDELELDAAGRPVLQRRLQGATAVAERQITYEHGGQSPRVKSVSTVPTDGGASPLTVTRHYASEAMPWGACQASSPGDCYEPLQVDTPRQIDGQNTYRRLGYDELGRLSSVTILGAGGVTATEFEYTYDNLDCLREIVGGGRSQQFECDPLGRTVAEIEWATRTWQLHPDGTTQTFTDFNGTQTHFDLDPSGWRVGTIRYENEPEGVVEVDDIEFSYFDNDLVATMVDGTGTTQYAYDSLNRLVARTYTPSYDGATTRTLGYAYEPGGQRLASMDYWGAGSVGYTYDAEGQLQTLAPFGGATQSYAYADDGRVLEQSSSVMSTLLVYDPVRRLQALQHTGGAAAGAGPNILTLDYDAPGLPGRDGNGNIGGILEQWLDEDPLGHVFDYDAADRLVGIEHPPLDPELWTDDGDPFDESGELIESLGPFFDANEYDARGNPTRMMGQELEYDTHDRITTDGYAYDANGNLVCFADDGTCHCFNGVQDDDETGIDCGGADCECCLGGGGSGPPSFVGTACPTIGGALDWAALETERASYDDPGSLSFGFAIPYNGNSGCGSVTFELPVPCDGYADYEMFRMGGAIATLMFPPQLPIVTDNWVHNPGYYAEGMMDPFYMHPAKSVLVDCAGAGGMCLIGNYGDGLSDFPLEPCNLARQDVAPAPMQPGAGAYDGNIRAFPVYQRAMPDLQYPDDFQLCYDRIDFHAQGGVVGTCQNDGLDHGRIYVVVRLANACG